MFRIKEIDDQVFYVGVNDRNKDRFENLWPLPYGVSYNSYLIKDEKTVLVDTVDVGFADVFIKKVTDVLDGRPLDYLVINHMEPDHGGSIRLLRQYYPDVVIIGNKKTFGMLEGFHGITDGLQEVKEGDTLSIGSTELVFYMAPMVHWPEVMLTYDKRREILFSADAFGTYGALDGGIIDTEMNADRYWNEMIRYYANIVGKYGGPTQKALKKLEGVSIKTICSTHGPIWRDHVQESIRIYDKLSRYEAEVGATIIYGSMYGNTEQLAEAIAYGLAENGIKDVVLHNVSKTHSSYILRDVFKYKGVIIGSPTYSGQLFPEIDSMLSRLELRDIKNRYFSCFGSFSWAGAAVKRLLDFNERVKWELVGEPLEQKLGVRQEKYAEGVALGAAMANRLKQN